MRSSFLCAGGAFLWILDLSALVGGESTSLLRYGSRNPDELKRSLIESQEATIEKLKQAGTPEELLEAVVNGIEERSESMKEAIGLLDEALGSEILQGDESFASMVANAKQVAQSADAHFQELLMVMKSSREDSRLLLEAEEKDGIYEDENETAVEAAVPEDGFAGTTRTTNGQQRKKKQRSNNNTNNKKHHHHGGGWSTKSAHAEFRERVGPKHSHLFDLQDAMTNGNHAHLERTFTAMHQHYSARFAGTGAAGRRMEEGTLKQQKCAQLKECAEGMSMYDFLIYFHSDDLDPELGTLDASISFYDEENLSQKKSSIDDAAKAINDDAMGDGDDDDCDDLLQQFHRNVEFGGVPFWEGGTVGQVCFAQGTTVAVQMEEIAKKISFDTADLIVDEFYNCTQALYDERTDQGPGERFHNDPAPFEDRGKDKYSFPTEYNTDKGRDDHGHVSDKKNLYKYEDTTRYDQYIQKEICRPWCWRLKGIPGISDKTDCNAANVCDDAQDLVLKLADSNWVITDEDGNELDKEEWVDSILGPLEAYVEGAQKGFELLFGDNPSVGYVCGTQKAIAAGGQIPGYCCLDAPFENNGDLWGSPYECTAEPKDCQNMGPYLSGLNEEACKVQGGTFCRNPVNCTVLRDCVQDEIDSAAADIKLTPYKIYLESSPNITNPLDAGQCGEAREYFGFQPTFINDKEVCDNVEQLRFTRNFQFLEEFFDQGDDGTGGGDGPGDGLPALVPPNREKSEKPGVKNGIIWRKTNFGLGQLFTTHSNLLEAVKAFACPDDLTGAAQTACATFKNVAFLVISIIYIILQTAIEISIFTYGEVAEVGNVEPKQMHEDTQAIYDNQVASAEWQKDRYKEIYEDTQGIIDTQGSDREWQKEQFTETLEKTNTIYDEQLEARAWQGYRFEETLDKIVPHPEYADASGKFLGCNGIDENQDGRADECEEDVFPPSIVVPEGLSLNLDCKDASTICIDKVFPSKEAVELYLKNQLQVIDDCGHPDTLSLSMSSRKEGCETRFTATPRHTCDTSNVFYGRPRDFVIPVDSVAPEVSCEFRPGESQSNKKPEMRQEGNHLVVSDEGYKIANIPFVYDIQDDCNGPLKVRVSVFSNEYDPENAALLTRYSEEGLPDQIRMMVAPQTCVGSKKDYEPCISDPSGTLYRLYQIDVEVTDAAGNSNKATCHLAVEPYELRPKTSDEVSVETQIREAIAGSKTLVALGTIDFTV